MSQVNIFSSKDDDATDDRTASAARVTRVKKEQAFEEDPESRLTQQERDGMTPFSRDYIQTINNSLSFKP